MLPAFALALALAAAPAHPGAPSTLRLDYFHTAGAGEERFALDGLVLEGPWPGNPDRPIDDTNLGRYLLEVIDRATNRVLYSRGFASICGEWESTAEAKAVPRTFHESLRFPEPAGKVQVVLKKRDAAGLFREAWSLAVDPSDPTIDRTGPPAGKVWAVMENGPPRDKVDLLLLGDGYTAAEMGKWHDDAKRLAAILFSVSPFKERRADFNVWAIDTPSEQSGVARPSDGVQRRSALRAAYDAFGSERYVLAIDNKRVREVAAAAPYDVVEIVVNGRKYGGGGIFNLYATVASDNAFTPYVLVHEFGHHFAGLADEYYTSDVAYGSATERPEPWEPNVTADSSASKWRDLVTSGTPLPTPWAKDAFEAYQKEIQARRRKIRAEKRPEEEMEALFREEQQKVEAILGQGPHAVAVGAFEGAMYEAKGYYRAQADCMMFTRHTEFCRICRRALERVIDLYARPGR
ncbi:MAG TPA: M64 family metallopeptidase [Vicinamibacteria bacterium]|nr:M64 family metallopeptidase [Vicinamibacteria bacterium]